MNSKQNQKNVSTSLPNCITGASGSGVCGNRPCIEAQDVNCCVSCNYYHSCNSACGWLEDKEEAS